MHKYPVTGAAIGMFLFSGLDTLGLIAPFVVGETSASIATFIVYGGGIIIGAVVGESVRRIARQ